MYNSSSAELTIEFKSGFVRLEIFLHMLDILGQNKALIGVEPARGVTLHSVLAVAQ